MSDIDYELLWEDEIAEKWVQDFVYGKKSWNEISVEITDPDGDNEDGNFDVKNIIFTIKVNGKPVQLWVFYDIENEEMHECESLLNYSEDPEELGKAIYEINKRWENSK